MQIIGSVQIVTDVTSVVPNFFGCIALFDLLVLLGFTVNFALFVRMRWGVSPLRRRFSGAPRPPKDPLASWAQLDQLMGALLILLGSACFVPCCRRGCYLWGSHFLGRVPQKNKKLRVKTKGCCRNALRQPQFNYSFSRRSFFVCGTLKSTNAPIIVNIISGSIYAPL